MPDTTSNGGFLSGVSDAVGSILDNSSGIAGIISAVKGNNKPAAAPSSYDAYGRLPGQPGYGTAAAPTGVAGVGGSPSALPSWVKPAAIVAAALAAIAILWKLLKR